MFLVIGVLIAGMGIGVLFERAHFARPIEIASRSVMPAVMILLISMGLSVGLNQTILENIGSVVWESLLLALAAMIGSVLVAPVAFRIVGHGMDGDIAPVPPAASPWRTTIQIIAALLAGLLFSVVGREYLSLADISKGSEYALLLLLFLVGITIGADRTAWRLLRKARPAIFLVPILFVLGSLTGAGLASVALPHISVREGIGVGAGMGYYSLSSVLITKLSGVRLGVVALLANVMREIFTLLLAPHFVKRFGPMASIASGGATAMDTTLPIVILASGKEYAFYAIFSGVCLTLLVPALVSIIFSF